MRERLRQGQARVGVGAIIAASVLLFGCPTSSRSAQPAPLALQIFFQGRLRAGGTLENFRDKTRRDFTIAMEASWAGETGTLVEDVVFVDGERQHKVWTFDKTEPGHFIGHRADLTRDADVREDETGVHMSYKAKTRVPSGDVYALSFEDQLTQCDARTVCVTSDITYFLVPVGHITMTITKASLN